MKKNAKAIALSRRLLCALLCIAFLLGMAMLTSCNSDADSAEEESDGAATGQSKDEFTLDENGMVDVLVFTADAPMGTRLTAKNTEVVKMDPTNLPRNVVTDPTDARGKYTSKDFFTGDYVIKSRISKTKPLDTNEELLNQDIARTNNEYIVVTDFIKANTGEDLYDNLQMLINRNPGRTLYFPDGEYLISHPLETSSKPASSTSFYLSGGAVLKAHDKWKADGTKRALICFGTLSEENNIRTPGSNFYVMGGVLDGQGRADGVSVDSGRETLIKNVVIVNVRYGIHIKDGINNGSSDSDIDDVTIIGNGTHNSYGIVTVGYDNTISNARIYNTKVGMQVSSGTFVADCTVENTAKMEGATGFICSGTGDAWYSNCTSIDFEIAFDIGSTKGFYKQCNALWPSNFGAQHIAFKATSLRSAIVGCSADFPEGEIPSAFLTASGGSGKVVAPVFDTTRVSGDDVTANYLEEGTNIITPAVIKKED